jgi:hypothetical protein
VSVCRCFGSDRAPEVAPRGAFWSRTVLPTVARWFMPVVRETVDNLVQVRAALRCVIPYVLVWIFCVVGESRLEGVNRANLKFINLGTTASRISVRNKNKSEREGEKQIVSK